MATVHIIGGGISGLAAATTLAQAHVPVKLYEASAHAGGRARSSVDAALGEIDHGLHLIGGDAWELAAYLTRINAPPLTRVNFALPLTRAPLADYGEMLSLLGRTAGKAEDGLHLTNMLRHEWLPRAARLVLHTPPAMLSAQAARQAMRRFARHPRSASKHYMATGGLSAQLIAPALAHLDFHGGSVYFNHALKGLEWQGATLRGLSFARKKLSFEADDVLILATPPAFTQAMLPQVSAPRGSHSAIMLHFAFAHREAARVHAPIEAPVDLVRYQPGRISLAVRVADAQWHSDETFLAHRLWQWLQRQHPYLHAQRMPDYAVWREKRAGHLLDGQVPVIGALPPRVLIAGDWLEAHAPATLDAAAGSGHRAAADALALLPQYPSRQS